MKKCPDTQQSWSVYLLECTNDKLYCGITNDLTKRFRMHSQGKGAKFCRANPPLALVYLENNLSQSQALKREYQIKQLTRRQKLALCDRRQKLTGEASMSEVDC